MKLKSAYPATLTKGTEFYFDSTGHVRDIMAEFHGFQRRKNAAGDDVVTMVYTDSLGIKMEIRTDIPVYVKEKESTTVCYECGATENLVIDDDYTGTDQNGDQIMICSHLHSKSED